MQPFYVIMSGHNHLYLSQYDIAGTGPRWSDEQHMKAWQTLDAAEAALNDMHPEYRERLQAEVIEAVWVYDPKYKAEVLAIR